MSNARKDDSMKNWIFGLVLGVIAVFMYFSFMIKLW